MRKIFVLTIALCFLALPAMAQDFDSLEKETKPARTAKQDAGACQDDPRLETDIITIMESNTPVNPPITVTPETYLILDADILKRLAGQMVICPNNIVLKNGKPMKKVEIEFEPVWQAIQSAAAKGDMETAKKLMEGFTVKPKSTEEILNMMSKIQLNEKAAQDLFRAAGIQWVNGSGGSPQLVDIYSKMGGKANDDCTVAIGRYNDNEKDELKQRYKNLLFYGISDYSTCNNAANKLRAMSIPVHI